MFMSSEERFHERMRRRTSRILDDTNKQEEARRAGQFVADRAMVRASAVYNPGTLLSSSVAAAIDPLQQSLSDRNHQHDTDMALFRSAIQSASAAAAVPYHLATIPSFDGMSVESSDDDEVEQPHDLVLLRSTNRKKPLTTTDDFGSSPSELHQTSSVNAEIAVRRGSRRGLYESNERTSTSWMYPYHQHRSNNPDHNSFTNRSVGSSSDVDLTTITDAFTDFTTKESKKQKQQQAKKKNKKVFGTVGWWNKNKKKTDQGGQRRKDIDWDDDPDDYDDGDLIGGGGEAWMCGVCGQAFHSRDVAERHEDQHLRQVIQSLGWANDNTNLNFLVSPDATTSAAMLGNNSSGGGIASTAAAAATRPNHQRSLATAVASSSSFRRPRFDSSDSIPPGGLRRNSERFYSLRNTADNTTTAAPWGGEEKFDESQELLLNGRGNNRDNVSGSKRKLVATDNNNNKGLLDTSNKPQMYNSRLVSAGRYYASELPDDALIPLKRRPRTASGSSDVVRFMADPTSTTTPTAAENPPFPPPPPSRERVWSDPFPLLLNEMMQKYMILADEALLHVCQKATCMILAPNEVLAERRLMYLANDKQYYDELMRRALARRYNPSNRFRSDADNLLGKIQNKLLDAYQLMKEGDHTARKDQYNKKTTDGNADLAVLRHSNATLYVNVLVRNSVQVVKHELERLAREKWEHPDEVDKYTRFERFRVYAHMNMVKLAGLALASDFTPRRIAIQLSNDLYRLLTPRLKRRGVTIGTEIEYRVGGYFVLAVNINTIDWARLVKTSNKDLQARKAKWRKDLKHDDEEEEHSNRTRHMLALLLAFFRRLVSLSKYDIIDYFLSFMYHFHWIIYLPICKLAYKTPYLGTATREFIISSAIDEICYYVHEKGMEMEIRVCRAENQASFMLSALREIRADGRELKKKRQETEAQEVGPILGPLLGPAIKADKGPAIEPPGFELPPNLEYVGLELDLQVGFRRLRWAYLSRKSTFVTEALWKTESKYENITVADWSKYNDEIGDPNPPPTVNTDDFVGAEFESSYLMPKSAFVSANMSYATSQLIAYNDYCFCVKTRSRNPDVPFGSTFFAWTQFLVINTGDDSCKLVCSVEAEFPNGPPMVARQIQSGMRAGTGESFVLTGETIAKYANAFP